MLSNGVAGGFSARIVCRAAPVMSNVSEAGLSASPWLEEAVPIADATGGEMSCDEEALAPDDSIGCEKELISEGDMCSETLTAVSEGPNCGDRGRIGNDSEYVLMCATGTAAAELDEGGADTAGALGDEEASSFFGDAPAGGEGEGAAAPAGAAEGPMFAMCCSTMASRACIQVSFESIAPRLSKMVD
jgi:hypothetical protein